MLCALLPAVMSNDPRARVCYEDLEYDIYTNSTASVIDVCNDTEINNVTVPSNFIYDNVTYTVITIQRISKINGSLKIPDSVQYLYENCFKNTNVTDVSFGNAITYIPQCAFLNCIRLNYNESLQFPDTIEEIEQNAFAKTNIRTIRFEDSTSNLKAIHRGAFNCCKLLIAADLPSSLKNCSGFEQSSLSQVTFGENSLLDKISNYAFFNCTQLSSPINLPETVFRIGRHAFQHSGLIEININHVSWIQEYAFSNCSRLSIDVIFSDNLAYIADYLFFNTSIKTVKVGNNVKEIRRCAFRYCKKLTNVILSDSIISIGTYAFFHATMETIEFGENLEIINDSAFYFSSLRSITFKNNSHLREICNSSFLSSTLSGTLCLPDSLEIIDYRAFAHTRITGVKFGSGIREIKESAFRSSYIEEIVFPDSLEIIHPFAFSQTLLTSIKFGEGLKVINQSFSDCLYLTEPLEFPEGLEIIDYSSFENCYKLSGPLILPSSLIEIGAYAFFNCYQLSGDLYIRKSIKKIGSKAFSRSGITNVLYSRKSMIKTQYGTGIFESSLLKSVQIEFASEVPAAFCKSCAHLTGELIIPGMVREIQEYAFAFTGITSLIILKESTKEIIIDQYAFYSCQNLIMFPQDIRFAKIGKYAFSYTSFDTIALIVCGEMHEGCFSNCEKITGTININCTFNISSNAFSGCSNIEAVNLINTTHISENAFSRCYSLKSFTFEGDRSGIFINDSAFSFCTRLEKFTWISGIEYIGKSAFFGCKSLAGVLPLQDMENLTHIDDDAFFGCESLSGELILPPNLKTIGEKAFTECNFAGSLFIPDSVQSIGPYAFFKCQKFSGSLVIGNGCTEIGESAFSMCNGMKGSLTLGSNLTTITQRAFFGCSSFSGNLNIPDSVTTIESSAFAWCSGFTGVLKLSKGLLSIGENSFAQCTGFSGKLVIPRSVKNISKTAFYSCKSIVEITFESSDVKVEFMAFSRLHIECYNNAPKEFEKNDPELYSSDNFRSMKWISFRPYFSSCLQFRAVNYTLAIIASIFGLAMSLGFIRCIKECCVEKKMPKTLTISRLRKILVKVKGDSSVTEENWETKITEEIKNGFEKDKPSYQFALTKSAAKDALSDAIQQEWPDIHNKTMDYVFENAFEDTRFYNCSVCCCGCFSKCISCCSECISCCDDSSKSYCRSECIYCCSECSIRCSECRECCSKRSIRCSECRECCSKPNGNTSEPIISPLVPDSTSGPNGDPLVTKSPLEQSYERLLPK